MPVPISGFDLLMIDVPVGLVRHSLVSVLCAAFANNSYSSTVKSSSFSSFLSLLALFHSGDEFDHNCSAENMDFCHSEKKRRQSKGISYLELSGSLLSG